MDRISPPRRRPRRRLLPVLLLEPELLRLQILLLRLPDMLYHLR